MDWKKKPFNMNKKFCLTYALIFLILRENCAVKMHIQQHDMY